MSGHPADLLGKTLDGIFLAPVCMPFSARASGKLTRMEENSMNIMNVGE